MKVNTQLPIALLLIIGTLSCLNLHVAATQSVTTASSSSYTQPKSNSNDETAAYWEDVYGGDFKYTGKTRTYYIAAEETVWDYCPNKTNLITGAAFEGQALNVVTNSATRIGCQYVKCLYKEYTNANFNVKKVRSADDEHLGFLGPTIRAEVGDMIKVVFLNKCKFPATVHAHAVFYKKDSEGALYNDGTRGADKLDDAVQPGKSYTYTWPVPKRAGPGPMDGTSVMWMYHSHTDEVIDFYAGLVGCMAITRQGMGKPDGSPKDVDRELFIMYSVSNENNNPYLVESFTRFSNASGVLPTDGGFPGSNNKDAINGYIYGNGPMINIHKGQHVRWYTMSMGGFGDAHTPSWHGNSVVSGGLRMDVVSLLPAEMVAADMCPDNIGIWLFHCHVTDHLNAGMVTRYQVTY